MIEATEKHYFFESQVKSRYIGSSIKRRVSIGNFLYNKNLYVGLLRRFQSPSPPLLRQLLLPPLPLQQDGQEMPEIEFRPETIQKPDFRVFMTLPEHEIG